MISVINPHDGKCHLDLTGNFVDDLKMDYPSLSMVSEALKKNNITLIMAVDKRVITQYEAINRGLGMQAIVTDLADGASNIISIIDKSSQEISSTVYLTYDANKDIDISVRVQCPSETTFTENKKCQNVKIGEKVSFEVDITFKGPLIGREQLFKVSNLGSVVLQYNETYECPCNQLPASAYVSSGSCSFHGILRCGVCECDPSWFGEKCGCDKPAEEYIEDCKYKDTGLICYNRGVCSCNGCQCDRNSEGDLFTGSFCECNPSNCPKYNGETCGGKEMGRCDCETCICKDEFSGPNCAQRNCDNSKWIAECTDANKDICSARGICDCGNCHCPYGYGGKFCEIKTSPYVCADFMDEVSCFLLNTHYNKDYDCDRVSKNQIVDEEAPEYSCYFTANNGCHLYYNFENITDQTFKIKVKALVKGKDCPKSLNPAAVAGITCGVMILIILLMVFLFLILRYIFQKREYKKFLNEQRDMNRANVDNPLYQPVPETAPVEESNY